MMFRALFIVRRRWPVLVGLPLLAVIAAVVLAPAPASTQGTTYAATVVLSADQSAVNQTQIQQAVVTGTHGASAAAIADLAGHDVDADAVTQQISASFDPESYVITAVARDRSAARAEALARAFSTEFVALGNGGASATEQAALTEATAARDAARDELRRFLATNEAALAAPTPSVLLTSEQTSLEDAYNTAQASLAELTSGQRPTHVYDVVTVGAARVQAPGKLQALASPWFRGVLGLVLGLFAAGLVVLVVERANPRLDLPSQVEDLVDAPVLAMVPHLGRRRRGLLSRVDPQDFRGPFAESFRTLRSHLDFRAGAMGAEHPPRIMVTSASPGEGKSTTAAFLALSYAESERKPVVIGGDLRRPTIHRLFGVDRTPGLTTRSLPGGDAIALTGIVRQDRTSGVTVVPSGPSVDHVNEVVRDLVTVSEVAQASDQVVILDTAPVRVANDAIDFLDAVEWVVVVVRAGWSSVRAVKQMMHTLEMNGAQVVGVVLSGTIEAADASRDYYTYYAPEPRRRDRRRPAEPVGVAVAP